MVTLITPKVQSYIDPINGGCSFSYGTGSDTNQIIGRTVPDFVVTYQRFYFPDGSPIGGPYDGTADSLTFRPVAATCVFNLPFGNWVISAKDGNTNNVGVCWLDATTDPWTLIGEWGTAGSSSDFPATNIPNWFSLACIATENFNVCVTGSSPFGEVTPLLVTEGGIAPTGFQYVPPDGTGLVTAFVTAGQQSRTEATAYWLQAPVSTGDYSLCRYTITEPLGSETAELLHTFSPSAFVTGGTTINRFTSFAFDQTDHNLISYVTVTDNLSVVRNWLVKFDSETGAIIWQIELLNGPGASNVAAMSRAVIKNSRLFWFGYYANGTPVDLHVIDTSTGIDTVLHDFTLGTALSCEDQISNDQINGIICEASWNSGQGSIELLNATPSTGSSLAAVYFIDGSPTRDHISVCPNPITTE